MATNISQWYPKVSIPDVPNPVKKEAVIETIRDFLRHTHLWVVELTATGITDLVDGTSSYALTSTQGDIIGVDHAENDYDRLTPVSEEYLNENHYGWRDQAEADPIWYYVDRDRNIILHPTPSADATDALGVWVSLMPDEDSTTVEDFLWNDHWRTIAMGAKSILYEMIEEPWGDIKKAEYFRAKYEDRRDEAETIKDRDYTTAQNSYVFRVC